jgi:hypothetical protein
MQRKTAKEAEVLGDAFKKVADEFARLSATAAGERGLKQVTRELDIVNQNVTLVNNEFAKTEEQIQSLVIAQAEFALSTGQVAKTEGQIREAFREQNKELFFKLDNTKKTLDAQKEQLETEKSSIEATQFISDLRKQSNIAESLSIKEQIELRKKLTDLEIRTIELTNAAQAEVLRNVEKLKEEIRSIANDPELWGTAQGMKAISALRTEITNVQNGVNKSTSAFIDRTLKQQALLSIAYQNNLYLAEDENLTYEQRQKYFDTAINQKRNELELQRQSLQEQLKLTTDEQAQIGIEVQLINLGQESVELNRQAAQFAQKRADAIFQEWLTRQQNILAMEEEIRIMEQRSLDEVLPIDDNTDNLSLRLDLARDEIDRETNYRIEQAIRVGDRIMALDIEKNAFLQAKYQEYLNARYSEEEAMAMAIAERNKEFANAEKDMRKEAFNDIFQAAGELASAALTAIFGDSKEVAIAQVVIDTAMGIQKIWAQSGMNPIVGGLLTAALAAKGITAISKIRNTEVGDSGSSGPQRGGNILVSQVTERGTQAQGMGAISSAANAAPPQQDGRPISVFATVDRRGLALAVRDGERSIRTQQYDFK